MMRTNKTMRMAIVRRIAMMMMMKMTRMKMTMTIIMILRTDGVHSHSLNDRAKADIAKEADPCNWKHGHYSTAITSLIILSLVRS